MKGFDYRLNVERRGKKCVLFGVMGHSARGGEDSKTFKKLNTGKKVSHAITLRPQHPDT